MHAIWFNDGSQAFCVDVDELAYASCDGRAITLTFKGNSVPVVMNFPNAPDGAQKVMKGIIERFNARHDVPAEGEVVKVLNRIEDTIDAMIKR
jgi:hypothetical protein